MQDSHTSMLDFPSERRDQHNHQNHQERIAIFQRESPQAYIQLLSHFANCWNMATLRELAIFFPGSKRAAELVRRERLLCEPCRLGLHHACQGERCPCCRKADPVFFLPEAS